MNRLKLIVLSSALSLITVGVFAGKGKFVDHQLWYDNSGTMTQITSNFATLSNVGTTGSSNASIQGSSSKALYISTDGGLNFTRAKVNF
ncbi:hypothetical protein DC498_22020 [Terrimonas sp.]|uniref:hypothetical protein n=1 Tax=Terrimonas sp. TaxID=1914338 RepID=UPI000D515F5A|nr:hypothetical protein [Terrimonas sp.]PVD50001.1 hypothetical protein DC498_22020 [Terrimonas sp.]